MFNSAATEAHSKFDMLTLNSVLVVCLAAFAAGNVAPESEMITRGGRIVGGHNAVNQQFPYQVLLRPGNSICGGSIINNRWILSAAHCTFGHSAFTTRVIVGAVNRMSSGVLHTVSRIVNHPKYQPLPVLANDISVVQTINAISFNAAVQPIGLGSNFVGAGVTAVASGWGVTSWPGSSPAMLQWISLRTISNADCLARHNALNPRNSRAIHDNVLCTFTQSGQGVCGGDSGGPLVAGNLVIGLVSWGVPCGRGVPDAFARVASHRPWIMSTIA